MVRRNACLVAVAAALGLLAGCGGGDPIEPMPVEAAGPASPSWPSLPPPGAPASSVPTSVTPATTVTPPAAATTRAPPRPKPTRTTTTTRPPSTTEPTSACLGAVRYDLDLQNTVLDQVRSMCFHAGGVLRLQGIGPGLVTATPTELVSRSYEAGVQDLRFLDEGTVTVTIPQDDRTHTIEVVVIR